jgi:hypothetical protein
MKRSLQHILPFRRRLSCGLSWSPRSLVVRLRARACAPQVIRSITPERKYHTKVLDPRRGRHTDGRIAAVWASLFGQGGRGLGIGYATIRRRPPGVSNFAQSLAPNRLRLGAMRTPSEIDSELKPAACGVVAPVFLPQPDFHLGRAGAGSPNQLRNWRSVRCTSRAKVSL